jgi:hypothetical protein
MRTVTRAFVLLTLAALVSTACGSKARLTKPQYERQVNHIIRQLTATLDSTFSSPKLLHPTSLKDAAEVLSRGQKTMEEADDKLDALNAPQRIEGIHEELVQGIRDFANSFGDFANATAKGDLAAIQRFNQQVSDQTLPAMTEIRKAVAALKSKGFDVSKG